MKGSTNLTRTLGTGLGTVAFIALLAYASSQVLARHTHQPQTTATATHAGLPGTGPSPTPADGLSDAQRNALYQQQMLAYSTHLGTWLRSLDLATINLRALPRVDLDAYLIPERPTLQDAVRSADVIVAGQVSTIQPTPDGLTTVTLNVSQTVKGVPSPEILLHQNGGLQPTQDWTGVYCILQNPGEQLLLPGDNVVLLLQFSTKFGYSIQGVSGFYMVQGGVIAADSLNTWGTSVNGLTENAFVAELRAAE
jgi:hypothetical protein